MDWVGWSILLGVFFAMVTPELTNSQPGISLSIALQLKQVQLLSASLFPTHFINTETHIPKIFLFLSVQVLPCYDHQIFNL